jgi:hypothetical protein
VQDRPICFGVHFLPSDGHVGLSVSEDDAINCVPDSLFTFLNLVYGGQDILNQDGNVNFKLCGTKHPVFTFSDSSDFSASPVSILSTSW